MNIFNILWYIPDNIYINIDLFNWVTIGSTIINYNFTIDNITLLIIIPIGIITILVLIYSLIYIHDDINKFIIYISLFGISMIIYILSNNYMVMFIGWEFMGIMSYLLISFWYQRIITLKSALLAILYNRIGDLFYIIGMSYLLIIFNTLNINIINTLIPYIDTNIINIIVISFLIGAIGKSAQLGLHTWLIYAMEGPTPVSSLLHAATMVCSGIYLLIRSWILIEYTETSILLIIIVGSLTTLVSGIISVTQFDIKKIIALSTMSQLGIMMVSIGVSNFDYSLYHLYNHAFYKALLFMSAGSVIHVFIAEYQDLRKYGSINLPIIYMFILIGSLSLMAIPGLTGFYSKDLIIESTFNYKLIYIVLLISSLFTYLYSIKIIYYTFINQPKSNKLNYLYIKENYYLNVSMFILSIYSIFLGINKSFILNNINVKIISNMDYEFMIHYLKSLPIILLIISIILYSSWNYISKYIPSHIFKYFNNKLYYDHIIYMVNNYIFNLSVLINLIIENGLFKVIGFDGVRRLLNQYNILLFINLTFILFNY